MSDEDLHRRVEDQSWYNALLARFWHWVDHRSIDKHAVMFVVVYGTIRITTWAMGYIEANPNDAGTDIGLKVAAVLVPWGVIATPTIKWYFETRST